MRAYVHAKTNAKTAFGAVVLALFCGVMLQPASGAGQEVLVAPEPVQNAGKVEFDQTPHFDVNALTVVKALNEALVNGPRAAAIRSQLAITRAGIATATQAPNPSFFFDRGIVAEQENRIGPVLIGDPPWKLLFRLTIASRMTAQAKIDLLTAIWSLRNDVRRAYVELAVAQETQKILEQFNNLNARLLRVSQKRLENGDVPGLDLMRAQLAASKSEVDLRVGLKRIARAKQQLNILMGRPMNAVLTIQELPDYASNQPRAKLNAQRSEILPDFTRDIAPSQTFVEKALASRLELKSLALQLKVNKANQSNTYANIIPDTSFAFGKSEGGNPPAGPKITAVFMTLNQEIPVTNIQQGGIYLYKAIRYQLQYQIGSQQNQVTSDVSNAYYNLIAARDKIRVYQEQLLLSSNEVARLAQRSYESGQSDITAALLAQQINVQLRSEYLDAVNLYASAFTDLEFAVGKPLQ